jgi:hypothetical protein
MEEALKERLLEVGVLDFVHATHAQLDQRHRRFHQCNVVDLEQDWETRLGRQSEWIGLSPFVDPLLMWVSPVEVGVEVSQDAVLLSIVSREIDTELRVEVLVIDKNISLVGGVFAESHITVKAIRTVAGRQRAMSVRPFYRMESLVWIVREIEAKEVSEEGMWLGRLVLTHLPGW